MKGTANFVKTTSIPESPIAAAVVSAFTNWITTACGLRLASATAIKNHFISFACT